MEEKIKIIECPRDAMQGIKSLIPTAEKIKYINQLLKTGVDTIDFGSFVSPKAIPQMRDTAEVLAGLDLKNTSSKLLAIVANLRGANDASSFDEINYLGFPFSISEEFQIRNTGTGIDESLNKVESIQEICLKTGKKLVIYISMAFGNPYGEPWHPDIAVEWSEKLHSIIGVDIIALSDTIGVSNPGNISSMFRSVSAELPKIEFGVHLHTVRETAKEKVEAAYHAGCRRFDGAIKGYGGCPMAKDEMTGNMPTEIILDYCNENNIETGIAKDEFEKSLLIAGDLFNKYH